MKRLFRLTAWLLLIAIVVLSVVPPHLRPVTPAPHDVEHLAIFLMTGLAFGFGYASRHGFQVVGLVAFAAAIEVIQLAIPGRHSRLSDFLVDAVSVSVGVILSAAISRPTKGPQLPV